VSLCGFFVRRFTYKPAIWRLNKKMISFMVAVLDGKDHDQVHTTTTQSTPRTGRRPPCRK
jgi:hypothetical protein